MARSSQVWYERLMSITKSLFVSLFLAFAACSSGGTTHCQSPYAPGGASAACNLCLQQSCESVIVGCFGDSWQNQSYGGACGGAMECECSCASNDQTCQRGCFINAPQGCQSCMGVIVACQGEFCASQCSGFLIGGTTAATTGGTTGTVTAATGSTTAGGTTNSTTGSTTAGSTTAGGTTNSTTGSTTAGGTTGSTTGTSTTGATTGGTLSPNCQELTNCCNTNGIPAMYCSQIGTLTDMECAALVSAFSC